MDTRAVLLSISLVSLIALAGVSAIAAGPDPIGLPPFDMETDQKPADPRAKSDPAVAHTLSGVAYTTFTARVPQLRSAAIGALERMGFRIAADKLIDVGQEHDPAAGHEAAGHKIEAKTGNRKILIELEPVDVDVTRMHVTAEPVRGIFRDRDMAAEIIVRTARVISGRWQASAIWRLDERS